VSSTEPTGYVAEFVADDGAVYTGAAAIIFAKAHWEAGGFAGLERDVGHGFETHEAWRHRTQRTHVKTQPRPRQGRTARPARNAKRRGSRRSSGSSPPSADDPHLAEASLSPLLIGGAG
jgi:hypothetical protein